MNEDSEALPPGSPLYPPRQCHRSRLTQSCSAGHTAPQGTPLWHTPKFNFAPRLGVAWVVHDREGRETVLRGGGGVFYDTANQLATQGYNGIGFQALKSYYGSSLPVTSTQLDFSPSVTAPYTSGTIYAFPQHLQLPYTLQWNVSLDQALGKNQVLTLSYVGSSGRRLIQEQQYSLHSLNSNFGTVILIPGGITSNYQSLQAKFQRSISNGLQALASYTWSHSLDFGSNNASLPVTRGNSDFDVRHNFQAGVSWDIPTPHERVDMRLRWRRTAIAPLGTSAQFRVQFRL